MRAYQQELLVASVPTAIDNNLLSFQTCAFPKDEIKCSSDIDIARKRNIGLLLAHLCDWQTIMYLDDDIIGLATQAVSRAAGLTARFMAVGFEIGHYTDNSIICHSYRLADASGIDFLAAVRCSLTQPDAEISPLIYNKDWLRALTVQDA